MATIFKMRSLINVLWNRTFNKLFKIKPPTFDSFECEHNCVFIKSYVDTRSCSCSKTFVSLDWYFEDYRSALCHTTGKAWSPPDFLLSATINLFWHLKRLKDLGHVLENSLSTQRSRPNALSSVRQKKKGDSHATLSIVSSGCKWSLARGAEFSVPAWHASTRSRTLRTLSSFFSYFSPK